MKFILALGLFLIGVCSPVLAAEIKVLSVGTVSSVLKLVIPEFERSSGNKVQISYGGPATVLERLSKGEPADVVIVSGALWEQAEKSGRLVPQSKTIMPATPYAVGMIPGAKPSEPMSVQYFQRLVEDAKSIALVDRSPSTTLLMQNLGKLGVAAQLEAKAKVYPSGSAIAEALARAEVEMGITTLSELVFVPQVEILGAVPSEILPMKATSMAAVNTEASSPREAAALIQFLVSPTAIAAFKAKGFEAN
jgi:molybdate transport system substrate-binding protein